MKKRILGVLLLLSICIGIHAQSSNTNWAQSDNQKLNQFDRINKFLSVPDISSSAGNIEIRLYRSVGQTGQMSMTSLMYKNNQWTATFYSRRKRTIDDPADATFPLKIREIKNKKLDSVFVGLVEHNVFTLPDQTQTKFPHALVPYAIITKSNQQIRSYRFQNTATIDKSYGEEFGEFKSIVELFAYLSDSFAEKNN